MRWCRTEQFYGLHEVTNYGALLDAVLVGRFVRPELEAYGGLVAGASGAEGELEIR